MKKWAVVLGIVVYVVLGGFAMRSLVVTAPKVHAATSSVPKKGQKKKASAKGKSTDINTTTTLQVALSAAVTLGDFALTTDTKTQAGALLHHDATILQGLKSSTQVKKAVHAVQLAEQSLSNKAAMSQAFAALETLASHAHPKGGA
ncbi:MAG: hypothetical protein M1499_08490 [Firmicutes bacterium]|nr:hypothetical protein [Bacillota bacterium]